MKKMLVRKALVAFCAGFLLCVGCSTVPDRETVSPTLFPNMRTASPRSSMEQINVVRLRMDKPEVERLGPGDVLGIYIANVTGKEDADIPIHNISADSQEAPASGYPFLVRSDGTLSLPLLKEPIYVEGMTMIEAEEAIRDAYTVQTQYLSQGANIAVSMIKKRTYHVTVIREDLSIGSINGRMQTSNLNQSNGSMDSYFGGMERGSAIALELPAYSNDVLEALSRSGGLPGLNAKNEVIILRKGGVDEDEMDGDYLPNDPAAFAHSVADRYNESGEIDGLGSNMGIVRIPIRVSPDAIPPRLSSRDVTLNDGDVVLIQSREAEIYYTGGLIKGGAHAIPRDYDLDVLGAIANAGGSIGSGAGSISGDNRSNFLLPPSRILVLREVNGRQLAIKITKKQAMRDPAHRILIEPNDVVLMEYTNLELVFNVLYSSIRFTISPSDFRNW